MNKQNLKRPRSLSAGLAASVAALLLGGAAPQAAVVGQWDFNSGNLAATLGQPMDYLDGAGAATQQQTTFTTMDIDGTQAKVMEFPACDSTLYMGYTMPTPNAGNGGGELVNQWTLILDLMYPTESDQKWRAIFESDGRATQDSDFFINPSNGIGISGNYTGHVTPNVWHRIGIVIDQSNGVNLIRKYIDGVKVGNQAAGGLEGRWALQPNWTAELFNDNDGDVQPGYVNSIQLRSDALTDGQMLALGGATAAGIPQTIPAIPAFIASRSPDVDAQNVSAKPLIQVVLDAGGTTVTADSIKLMLDDAAAAAAVTPSGNTFTASYQVPALLAAESPHKITFSWQDSGNGQQTNEWSFTVGAYKSITLPTALFLETFDEVAEEAMPTGWVVTNETDSLTAGPDLTNPNSDSYLDWVVIGSNTFSAVFDHRRLNVLPVVVNGVPLTSLISSNFAYAESDNRSGNQVQVLTSPDFDLSGKTNIYLSFHSIYEQNQDSLGAVEYSADQGQTWQPALYMLDEPDVVKNADGTVDAVATLTNPQTDSAFAQPYGAYIGAAITQDLAPFISPRKNDNPLESKRVEVLRLAKADNQAKVRVRFIQTGTGSWYFGVDDVGLYSIEGPLPPQITTQPVSQLVSAGSTLTLTVVASGTGPFTYQWKLNDADVSGATSDTLTVPNFSAAQAGDYTVVVSNAGGSTTSSKATIKAFSGLIGDNLVVHLKFDGNATDSSGRGNNGTEMGTPSYEAGKVGTQAMHLITDADYVSLGSPADLNFGTSTDFSISFWTKLNTWSGDPSFVGNKDWNSGGNQGYVLATDDDGHFQWNLAGAPGGRKDYDGDPGTFSDDAWHLVVVTFDRAGNASTFIDGTLRDARSLTADQNNLDTPSGMATNIGQDGTGNYGPRFSDAFFDDVGIWRRQLTVQEIVGIYEAGQAGKDLSTVVIAGPSDAGTLGVELTGGKAVVSWESGATLQSADAITGPWTDETGATSPYQVTPAGSGKFYRLRK